MWDGLSPELEVRVLQEYRSQADREEISTPWVVGRFHIGREVGEPKARQGALKNVAWLAVRRDQYHLLCEIRVEALSPQEESRDDPLHYIVEVFRHILIIDPSISNDAEAPLRC